MKRLTSPSWLLRHAAVVVLVAGFVALGWWQIGRAAGGNPLSFGYSIEWPFFALFVIFIWIREMRATLRADRPAAEATEAPRADRSAVPGVTAFDATAALARRAEADRVARQGGVAPTASITAE